MHYMFNFLASDPKYCFFPERFDMDSKELPEHIDTTTYSKFISFSCCSKFWLAPTEISPRLCSYNV